MNTESMNPTAEPQETPESVSDHAASADEAATDSGDLPSSENHHEANSVTSEDKVHTSNDTQPTAEQVQATEIFTDLEALALEAKRNKEGWQRTLAEFNNYKKRIEREKIDSFDSASLDIIKQLLPIIDDFQRAFENIPEGLNDHPWVTGTASIGKKFDKILEVHQVERVDPTGQPFNPEKHQALGIDPEATVESGFISHTLQAGYVKGDKVIRPALVRVAE
ncbi:MAG UNVERIFIED_CONTAM: nucleotide exchange factor GrpE [Anaerolineae bacterium]